MAIVVNMPRLSDTMEEGVVASWLKNIGDYIEEGDILAEIETDKATMEFESFNEGTLLHIGIQEGETAPVDTLLAIIGEKGEDITELLKASPEPAKEAIKDIVGFQQRMISLENIQKTVAEYYKIRVSDIRSKKRTRSITRPRQIAMTLSKELTNHSLPEIGDAFGGRDHTTVIHAVKKVAELKRDIPQINEDYENLLKILSS